MPGMRTLRDIRVDHAIVHRLPGKGSPATALSDLPLDLAEPAAEESADETPAQKITRYLARQVQGALRDGAAVGARFEDGETNEVRRLSRVIIGDAVELVASSQQIADRLAKAIGDDQRIKPGHLAVCRFRAGDGAEDQVFLALLKIDLIEVLVEQIEELDGDHHNVRLAVRDDALATLREKLQKAALIRVAGDDEYEMLLLDKQVAAAAAEFFRVGFLGAAEMADPHTQAFALLDTVSSVYDELTREPTDEERDAGREAPLLDPEQADALRQRIPDAFTDDHVDLEAWLGQVPIPEPAKEHARDYFREADVPTEYDIDRELAQRRLVKKMKFVGDLGVRVEFDADQEANVIVEKSTEGPEGNSVTTLTMRVPNLRWVKR